MFNQTPTCRRSFAPRLTRFARLAVALLAVVAPPSSAQTDAASQTWFKQAATQLPTAPAPLPPARFKADGDVAEWADLPNIPLGLAFQSGFDRNWIGRSDLSARFWLAHDDLWLYVVGDVVDDQINLTPKGDLHNGDQLRLFLASSTTATDVKMIVVIPPQGTTAARVLDGATYTALPDARLAGKSVDHGYRFELRLPWAAIPGGQPTEGAERAVALYLQDYDSDTTPSHHLAFPATSDLSTAVAPYSPSVPPTAKPTTPAPGDWQPPSKTVAPPTLWATLAFTGELTPDDCLGYLAALVPVASERGVYDEESTVLIEALNGLPGAVVRRVDLWGTPLDGSGSPALFTRGADWTEGAVGGPSWNWETPAKFAQTWLLVAAVRDPLTGSRSYGRVGSLPGMYAQALHEFKALRAKLLEIAVSPAKDEQTDTRRRRYIGSVLINCEDTQQSGSNYTSYLSTRDLQRLQDDLANLKKLAATAMDCKDPYAGKKGQYLRGYVSDIDDTVQHYAVGIPDDWAPGKHFPLIVSMHGYGFGQFCGSPAPLANGIVYLSPFGRGNGDYKLWCEQDILTTVAAMLDDYGCDPDRVYLTGGSMGGTGSWQIATIAPDLFAAIAPTMGNTNQRVWEEVWGWGQKGTTFLTSFRNWLQATTSSFTYAENLRNVPAYCLHGSADDIVPVGHSRTIVRRLRGLGYNVTYEEQAEVGHGGFSAGADGRQRAFLLQHKRNLWPRRVTFKSSWPRYDHAYWVKLERMDHPGDDAVIDASLSPLPTDAEETAEQIVQVTTHDVARLALTLKPPLIGAKQPVRVIIDGMAAFAGQPPADGIVRCGLVDGRWKQVEPPQTLEKNARVGGPVEHAFMQRFLLVVGTHGDRRTNEVNRRMAQQLAEKWKRWGREQPARVKNDFEVNDRDIADSNLICYGGPESNSIVAKVNDKLPIRIVGDTIVAGDETIHGEDLGVKMCYPNPLNPQRYLCVFAGVTWRGTWDINGRFGNFFDWGVFDDRNWYDFNVFDAHTQNPETHVLVGYFDADWKLDHGLVFRGDPDLRAATQPRKAPDPLQATPTDAEVYIGDLVPKAVRMEKGVLGYDQSFEGRKITLGDQTFDRGLGVHPEAEVTYDIGGRYDQFEAWVGVDLEGATEVSAARESAEHESFEVWGDGKMLADSGEMRWNTRPKHLIVPIKGVKELRLNCRALDGRKWLFGDASWGIAKLTRGAAPGTAAPADGVKPTKPAGPKVLPPMITQAPAAERLSLDGAWRLGDFAVGAGVGNGAAVADRDLPERNFTVPGGVVAALCATGELKDPYLNDNLKQVDALGAREWWAYRRFQMPTAWMTRRLRLELAGLSGCGDVWLNGAPVGSTASPFARLEADVTALVKPGDNILAVRLTTGPAAWTGVNNWSQPGRDKTLNFDAAWGDDAGGRAVPLGLFGDVNLSVTGPVVLDALRLVAAPQQTLAAGEGAQVPARLTVVAPVRLANEPSKTDSNATDSSTRNVIVRAIATTRDGSKVVGDATATVKVGGQDATVGPAVLTLELPSANLWQPSATASSAAAGAGYRVTVTASADGGQSDVRVADCGFRSVSVTDGKLVANGQPLTLRAARLQPTDRLLRQTNTAAELQLRELRDAGFNAVVVDAGAETAFPALWARCDELGLFVIYNLPLTGALGGLPEATLTAAIDGVTRELRNHPCRLGYLLGHDLAGDADTTARLNAVTARLAIDDPTALVVSPIRRDAPNASWTFTALTPPREGTVVDVQQIRLPAAPPGDLNFLDRRQLSTDTVALPWPLTDWWQLRGGSQTDLLVALAWLGPVNGEDDYGPRLTLWQAESARQQTAEALSKMRGVYVDAFNDSWPRIGGALVDSAGRPRPAWGALCAATNSPSVRAMADRSLLTVGQTLTATIYAPGLVRASQDTSRTVRCRLQSPEGQVEAEKSFDLPTVLTDGPLGTWQLKLPATAAPGPYLLLTELVGGDLPADVVPIGVQSDAADARLIATSAGAALPAWPGIQVVDNDDAHNPPAVWLVAGRLSENAASALEKSVRAGAGVVFWGQPQLPYNDPLANSIGLQADEGDVTRLAPSTPVQVVHADHPALAGLAAAPATATTAARAALTLPDGRPIGFYEVATSADVVLRYGANQPMLVESRYGRGRVLTLLADSNYCRRLALWTGGQRFQIGLLAYAANLTYGETQRLLSTSSEQPLAGLTTMSDQTVAIDNFNQPIQTSPGEPGTIEFTVRNAGSQLLPRVLLTTDGLPTDATARLSTTLLSLRPGEGRKVRLTVDVWRAQRWTGRVKVSVSGLGVKAASADTAVEIGD